MSVLERFHKSHKGISRFVGPLAEACEKPRVITLYNFVNKAASLLCYSKIS